MKLFISEKAGCIYWLEGSELFYAPLSTNDAIIDTDDDGGSVDFDFLDNGNEKLSNGQSAWHYAKNVERLLTIR